MKEKKVFTVTDLGGGDGGKGGVVHAVCIVKDAHTVVKVGGAQGSHGVRTSHGESFNFSQFGCGTFEGARTHISNRMVIDPFGILREGDSLRLQHSVSNAFDLLTLDEDCLCTTPFHGSASRLRELARKGNQKGTVGVGTGEAKLDSELHPELAIYVRDLGKPDIRDKIEAVRRQKLAELAPIIENIGDLWPADRDLAREEIGYLHNPDFVPWMMEGFGRLRRTVNIVGTDYLEKEVLSRDGVVVVESSHGVLTDKYHGFHPYTSRLRTVPSVTTFDLLRERGYDGQVVRLGVTRAYQIRHGAGPLVTESSELVDKLLPGSSKAENRWQGKVRVGSLDLVALRYSVGVCGGPEAFDGLAVTWFDQIQTVGKWDICESYVGTEDRTFFGSDGEILIRRGTDESQIRHQEALAKQLFGCKPVGVSYVLDSSRDRDYACKLCDRALREFLNIPVRMISFGPTEDGKVCL
ncbi:MAG: adenylosuccinate synthetase [Candidatus Paceibacterota bacterium]